MTGVKGQGQISVKIVVSYSTNSDLIFIQMVFIYGTMPVYTVKMTNTFLIVNMTLESWSRSNIFNIWFMNCIANSSYYFRHNGCLWCVDDN